MIQPKPLTKGSKIRIVCPSGYLPIEKAIQAKNVLTEWGYSVDLGETTATEFNYFSATDDIRLSDLQAALNDPDCAAILMGRGGYGMTRIIDQLDFTQFIQYPKWIIGFSDITLLHTHINQHLDIATLHAPMCGSFAPENLDQTFMQTYQNVLSGALINYQFAGHPNNQPGNIFGKIVGGNLCMLDHSVGTSSALDTNDCILFIEDIGEHLYKIDRMLYHLSRAGQLKHIKALLCGNFTDIEDTTRPFGTTLEGLILQHTQPLGIPVAFHLPIGHETVNFPLILGANYNVSITTNEVVLTQIIA